MSVSVTMPRLGESVSEGTVTRWLKKEGEQVEADEPLLEVSTDKVDTEIPAPAQEAAQQEAPQQEVPEQEAPQEEAAQEPQAPEAPAAREEQPAAQPPQA